MLWQHEHNLIILQQNFRDWATLIAWQGEYLATTKLVFATRPQEYSTGLAGRDKIHVTIGTNLAIAQAVLLHEMAHTALARLNRCDSHGPIWRQTFQNAATEILGQWGWQGRSSQLLTGSIANVFTIVEADLKESKKNC